MNIQRAAPVNELLARLLFLILPTALIGYFLLWNVTDYFTFLQNTSLRLTLYFAAAMAGSAVFYSFRFRFLPTFAGLIFLLFLFSKGLDKLNLGEFDQPALEANYKMFAALFVLGWIIGWGFLRLRYWSVIMAALLLTNCIYVIAKSKTDTVEHLLWAFAPVALYSVYIIFTAEQIYGYKDKSQKFWWFLTRRLVGFGIVALLLFGGVIFLMRGQIKETVANFGGGGKGSDNSMLHKDKNNNFDLKNYSQLRSSLGRSNELLFCAHIDNFFKGTDIPNPLYLTAFYYTKFDTTTETFERDSVIPRNDLFEPDPSQLSLFATKMDTNVVANCGTERGGKVVEIQVYSRRLSASTYLAPHTGYFVQPITVEKDFRDSFKTAFRAKSFVSELNSAYFVYNAKDPQIKLFQAKRFEILREVKDDAYKNEDKQFMQYYTYMPGDKKFNEISVLAHSLTANAHTPVDKVIALRDWFLSKDPAGQPLFKYTDNPGIPDIPNASKLRYFLFENRKGYCAYYAGATLFMLRSLGIPSRIAVGFLTEDRSTDKNKGWYWYYADQAHAWVQVYFPGFGWLDFDTTVGNDAAHESPKPDGTPPMQPPRAYLAADGIVTHVDTTKKIIVLKVKHMVYHDKEYKIDPATDASLDVHIASVRRDSVDVPLATVAVGEEATAVSYADAFKNLEARTNEQGITLLKRFPDPEPVDEVYLKRKDVKAKDTPPPAVPKETPVSIKKLLLEGIGIVLGLVLIFFLLPAMIFAYYRTRAKNAPASAKAYWTYRAAGFYLHQLGWFRGARTPMQYARDMIDPALGTAFTTFMNAYLKEKYAKQPLNEREQQMVNSFLPQFLATVRSKVPSGKRFVAFLRPLRSIGFFVRGDGEEEG